MDGRTTSGSCRQSENTNSSDGHRSGPWFGTAIPSIAAKLQYTSHSSHKSPWLPSSDPSSEATGFSGLGGLNVAISAKTTDSCQSARSVQLSPLSADAALSSLGRLAVLTFWLRLTLNSKLHPSKQESRETKSSRLSQSS